MIRYMKDRVLGAWNVVQFVECMLACHPRLWTMPAEYSDQLEGSRYHLTHRRVGRGKASADSLGVVGNHALWQLHGGRWVQQGWLPRILPGAPGCHFAEVDAWPRQVMGKQSEARLRI